VQSISDGRGKISKPKLDWEKYLNGGAAVKNPPSPCFNWNKIVVRTWPKLVLAAQMHMKDEFPPLPMDRVSKSEDEIRLLRRLCDETASRVQRVELLRSVEGYIFLDPEHQVVFESICFLLPRGGVSAGRLAVHLNNRGFPDVEIEKYFPGPHVSRT
jgi:hypothetical protein